MRSPITGLSAFEIFHRRSPFSGQSSWSEGQDSQRLAKGLAIRDSTLTQRRDKSCKLRKPETFSPGDMVLLQLTDKAPWLSGNKIIKKIRDNSYLIELAQGNSLIRNEKYLKHDLSHSGQSKQVENSNPPDPAKLADPVKLSDPTGPINPPDSATPSASVGTLIQQQHTSQLNIPVTASRTQRAGEDRPSVKTTSDHGGKK